MTELTVNSDPHNPGTKIELIVWPESPAPFFTNDAKFRAVISEMARSTGVWIVVGAIGSDAAHPNDEGTLFNSAAVISPKGEWTARYDKVHLVPFGEYLPFPSLFSFAGGLTKEVGQFERGTSRQPLTPAARNWASLSATSRSFPTRSASSPTQGAQVFVNISNDGWYGDSGAYAQHLNQTRMRAIENDRWLLSATNTGVTAAIDPWGRIVARIPRKKRTALVAHYALLRTRRSTRATATGSLMRVR